MTYLTDKRTEINDLLNKMRELIGEDPRSVTQTPKERFLPDEVFKNILSYCDDTIERKQKKHMKQLVNDFKTLREARERWYKNYGEDHMEFDYEEPFELFLEFESGCKYHDRGEYEGEGCNDSDSNRWFLEKWTYGYGFCFQSTFMCEGHREFRDMLVAEGYEWFPVVGEVIN